MERSYHDSILRSGSYEITFDDELTAEWMEGFMAGYVRVMEQLIARVQAELEHAGEDEWPDGFALGIITICVQLDGIAETLSRTEENVTYSTDRIKESLSRASEIRELSMRLLHEMGYEPKGQIC